MPNLAFSKMVLTFEENPTTGYMWDYQGNAGDTEHIKILKDSYACAEQNAPPGTGGHRTFHIEAKQASTIVFEMRRPWESKTIKPIRTVTVTVE